MLFPWVGMLEQVRLADAYVDYADVQFSKGSFVNRVQLRTAAGNRWMTVPLADLKLGRRIDELHPDESRGWRESHRKMLREHYAEAPFLDDALDVVDSVYDEPWSDLGALALASLRAVCAYLGVSPGRWLDVRSLGVTGAGSQRVLDIVKAIGGDVYVTGHGAARYLDHGAFAEAGVEVRYMDYVRMPYPQVHGQFDPHVSSLDLIANAGPEGNRYIAPRTRHWQEFLQG